MTNDFLNTRLEKRKQDGLLRQLSLPDKNLIDFSSNDYLGFARMQELWEPETVSKYGSTGSRLLTGNDRLTEDTEKFIADFHNSGSGLIFNSGYDANTGLFSCIASKDDTILYDELIHASVRDGIRLSPAKHFSFRHNDLNHLEDRIKNAHGRIFVAIETVYSMDGDTVSLEDVALLKSKYPHILLIADEAHATGVFAPKGEGRVQESGLESHFFARVHTFGKALGCQGAIVLGSPGLREYLINFSRPFIYTTALPLVNIRAIQRAYQLLQETHENLAILRSRIDFFKEAVLHNSTIDISLTNSAIQIISMPGNENARNAAQTLQDSGFDVRPILSPTVPAGNERLRICLHAFNAEVEIDKFIRTLNNILTP